MERLKQLFDQRFSSYWWNYLVQSGMATVAVMLALLALRQQNLIIVASFGATAFIVFAMPHSVTASPRNVLGGHLIGVMVGSFFALFPHESNIARDLCFTLAVGCSIFLMVVTNTEHPPAASTTLGVIMAGFSVRLVLGVFISIAILSLFHWLLRPFLRDLIKYKSR